MAERVAAPAPLVLDHQRNVALLGGELVANRLRARPRLRLALPTGHTPLGLYAALRQHAADGSIAAEAAELFQIDEYLGLGPADERSYAAYLRRELRGVRFGAIHGLDGATGDPEGECARHQALLDEAPLDLVVLGLGRDGHVAFDEPGAPVSSGVRRVRLHPVTREDAAADFGGLGAVPTEALTLGLRTLREARELLMLVTGEGKAEALAAMLEGDPGPTCPASLLREHPRLTIVCDTAAARLLTSRGSRSSDRALVVLGHREPGANPEHRISAESRQRLRRAVSECAKRPPRAVIFTGYTLNSSGLSEAEQLRAEWPLPEVPALLENGGRNTAENATCSLPLLRAIGDVRRVMVVTSAWHLRTPYFFAPYRRAGLRTSYGFETEGPWLRHALAELAAFPGAPAQRRQALQALRLPRAPTGTAGTRRSRG